MTFKRIGLLGGTFNPVHFGHLQLAYAAMAECSLDQVIFIPSVQPPHKDEASIASFADRIAMLLIAGGNEKWFSCSTIEGKLPTPSYTIDTLRAISRSFPVEVELFFIIGSDAFLDLLSWKSYKEILRCVALIVAERQGYQADRLVEFLGTLKYSDKGSFWQGKDGCREIILLQTMPDAYSSTAIRSKISKGISPDNEIPKGVIEYIKKHALYQSNKTENQYCTCKD
ncbi:MAG: nicotinate-nucleotide adenylyltransferase [Proteobacteria bacterium]|nr:nicotinate-nucleotide adenylyltransferase [Pseudomonadota bacterium]